MCSWTKKKGLQPTRATASYNSSLAEKILFLTENWQEHLKSHPDGMDYEIENCNSGCARAGLLLLVLLLTLVDEFWLLTPLFELFTLSIRLAKKLTIGTQDVRGWDWAAVSTCCSLFKVIDRTFCHFPIFIFFVITGRDTFLVVFYFIWSKFSFFLFVSTLLMNANKPFISKAAGISLIEKAYHTHYQNSGSKFLPNLSFKILTKLSSTRSSASTTATLTLSRSFELASSKARVTSVQSSLLNRS